MNTDPILDLYARLDKAVADENCDIFHLCHDISVIKGFWETPVPELTALGYRQLIHIAAEINEAEADRQAEHLNLAANEYADVIILFADLAGAFQGNFVPFLMLNQIRYRAMFSMDLDLHRQFGELCQAVYKHGFESVEALGEGMKFLNSVAYYGVYAAGSESAFQFAVLNKCVRNMSRPHRFGLGEK